MSFYLKSSPHKSPVVRYTLRMTEQEPQLLLGRRVVAGRATTRIVVGRAIGVAVVVRAVAVDTGQRALSWLLMVRSMTHVLE